MEGSMRGLCNSWNFIGLVAGLGALLMVSPVIATETIEGVWARNDGAIHTRFTPCGVNLCAVNTWAKDPKGEEKAGDRLIMTLRAADGRQWTGSAFDPQRNQTYTVVIQVAGKQLTTQGCVLGGLVCKTAEWSRLA